MSSAFLVVIAFSLGTSCCLAQQGQPMRFETPKMNEEEEHSMHIPGSFEMRCDACTAVAYQLTAKLKRAEDKRPSLKKKGLSESEYLDIIEDVCDNAWDNYGIKTVDGVNRLSGEGLEAKDVPGMMQGGGKWPNRLREKCSTVAGDVGEDEIYKEFRRRGELTTFLCQEFSTDCVRESHNEL
ncbi:marginal zone B- and B1-cell-specific protein-like [Dendronephthya gigantea]|uniref:marginal zone B- and B1-cell-specific protein-like n=1 Tax=Dendronephthya gigantea TaxID=151771 RepID=UPI001069F519|nr:marginal zone B- and B1-cell-specific protein-like [Dendronephthya gigantea]